MGTERLSDFVRREWLVRGTVQEAKRTWSVYEIEQLQAQRDELARKLDEADRILAGPVHGMLQTARGKCVDEEPYPELDAYLARIDLRVSAARDALSPDRKEPDDG